MTTNTKIKLSPEAEEMALDDLREYMMENFELDLGNLPAKFLLTFILEKLGNYFYDQAITDIEPWLYDRLSMVVEDISAFKDQP